MPKKNLFKISKILFALLGIGLFAFLINEIGLDKITSDLSLVGVRIVYLILIGITWHLLNSYAWYLLVHQSGLKTSLRKIFVNKWAAESLNSALPLGNLGGEAFRVIMLSQKLDKETALSNVVQDRLLHYLGSFIFLTAGSVFGIIYLEQMGLKLKVILLFVIALLIGLVLVLKYVAKKGLLKVKIKKFQKYIDTLAKDFFNRDSKVDFWVLFFNILARLLGTVEIFLVLHFLNSPLPFSTCLLINSFLVLINLIFFIVPGGIGVLEGGQILFMSWLNLSPSIGLSLAIVRRIRLLIMVLLGLLLVPLVPELKEKISNKD